MGLGRLNRGCVQGDSMLGEAAAELAATGGAALVTAMVTDGWEGVKARFARLLGRGDAREVEGAAARLEECRAALAVLTGAELQKARAEQEIAWRVRLGDLLERQPDWERELRSLVAEIRARARDSAVQVEQHVTGSGHAQQAVLGHGTQVNTFGGQVDPGPGR
jgi:hypothetical protein